MEAIRGIVAGWLADGSGGALGVAVAVGTDAGTIGSTTVVSTVMKSPSGRRPASQ